MGLKSEVKTLRLWPAQMAIPSTDKVYFTQMNTKNEDHA